MTLSVTIETDPLLFGKLLDTGLNDFVLRQNLVMAGIADLLSFRRRALQRLPDLLPPRGVAVSLARRFNALSLPGLLHGMARDIFSLRSIRGLGFDSRIKRPS
jgi:hypothetical protein